MISDWKKIEEETLLFKNDFSNHENSKKLSLMSKKPSNSFQFQWFSFSSDKKESYLLSFPFKCWCYSSDGMKTWMASTDILINNACASKFDSKMFLNQVFTKGYIDLHPYKKRYFKKINPLVSHWVYYIYLWSGSAKCSSNNRWHCLAYFHDGWYLFCTCKKSGMEIFEWSCQHKEVLLTRFSLDLCYKSKHGLTRWLSLFWIGDWWSMGETMGNLSLGKILWLDGAGEVQYIEWKDKRWALKSVIFYRNLIFSGVSTLDYTLWHQENHKSERDQKYSSFFFFAWLLKKLYPYNHMCHSDEDQSASVQFWSHISPVACQDHWYCCLSSNLHVTDKRGQQEVQINFLNDGNRLFPAKFLKIVSYTSVHAPISTLKSLWWAHSLNI